MPRMPGAIWHPLAADWASQPRMKAYDFFCLHTMVGTLAGTGTYFEKTNGVGYAGTESHFGVGPDGTIWQFQDTAFQADANADGNWHVISSENADTGAPFPAWGGSDVPALTPQQVEANARIAAWLHQTHGIPLGIAGSSKPGARGLAVHRYGVPGYMPAGAERWSTSQGKACPGDRRIAQLPAISARAQQIAGGAQEDDMPTAKEVADELLNHPIYFRYRNDADPRGYGEASATVIEVLRDTYLQMYWGNGLNLSWGPGVATQLQELVGRTAPTAGASTPVTVDAGTLAAALKDPAFLASLAQAVNDDAARRLAS